MNYLVLSTETLCQGTVVTASETSPYLAIHLDLPVTALVKAITTLANHKLTAPVECSAENFTQTLDVLIVDALIRLVSATESVRDTQTIAPLIIEEIIFRLLSSDAGKPIRNLAAISRTAIRIQDSMNYMQAQLHKSLTVAELAEHLAMSQSHYAHSFREVTGVTPMRYLRDLRLEKARNLLLYQGMRPNEAAHLAGFENTEHFNREFKRRYAKTPTAYVTDFANL